MDEFQKREVKGANYLDRYGFLPATWEHGQAVSGGLKMARALTWDGRWEMALRAIGQAFSLPEGKDGFSQMRLPVDM